MLIQSLEQKTRLALMTVLATVAGCTVICGICIFFCAKLVTEERQQIYVLDGDIPFLAERSLQEANFVMEAKAHIQLFHQYFFNLPPDNDYIKWTLGKAMYMADGTAMKQKQAMDENGFYSDIISSSAVCTIICDSINLDEHERKFTYYGTQLIKRRSRDMKRSIITGSSPQWVSPFSGSGEPSDMTNSACCPAQLQAQLTGWKSDHSGKIRTVFIPYSFKAAKSLSTADSDQSRHIRIPASLDQ